MQRSDGAGAGKGAHQVSSQSFKDLGIPGNCHRLGPPPGLLPPLPNLHAAAGGGEWGPHREGCTSCSCLKVAGTLCSCGSHPNARAEPHDLNCKGGLEMWATQCSSSHSETPARKQPGPEPGPLGSRALALTHYAICTRTSLSDPLPHPASWLLCRM